MNKKRENKKEILWIFLHIPKTGGTTFNKHLFKHFGKEKVIGSLDLRYKKDFKNYDKNKVNFLVGHSNYYGIHKHFLGKKPRYITFIRDPAERFVSEYNYQMKSKKNKISFEKWYKLQIKNEMTHFLSMKFKGKEESRVVFPKICIPFLKFISYKTKIFLQAFFYKIFYNRENNQENEFENAKKLLDKCWFVGITGNLDKDLKFLFKEMGLPIKYKNENKVKKSEKIFIPSKDTLKIINKENHFDTRLYKYAKKLNQIFHLRIASNSNLI